MFSETLLTTATGLWTQQTTANLRNTGPLWSQSGRLGMQHPARHNVAIVAFKMRLSRFGVEAILPGFF